VAKLRELILQMAVLGKLVRQDLDDGRPGDGTTVGDYLMFQNGDAFKSEWFVDSGVRLVRNTNVGHGELRWADHACITAEMAAEYERFALSEDDIIISLDRPLISSGLKVARVTRDDLPCLLLQRVAKAEFHGNRVRPDYSYMWLQSASHRRQGGPPAVSLRRLGGQAEAIPDRQRPPARRSRPPSPERRVLSS
jgi:type I restriction enzyme, S subunit